MQGSQGGFIEAAEKSAQSIPAYFHPATRFLHTRICAVHFADASTAAPNARVSFCKRILRRNLESLVLLQMTARASFKTTSRFIFAACLECAKRSNARNARNA
jgi:hypothetical protein